jgi:hypothetical protein
MVDLDDPTDRHFTYHDRFDHIFLSQKRMDWTYPSPEKYHALYPHFPVRSFEMFTLQGLYVFHPLRFIRNLKEFRAISRQKPLWLTSLNENTTVEVDYVFYKRTLWKNLPDMNRLGANFLDICNRLGFRVEGGLTRMRDDYRTGIELIDKYLIKGGLTRLDYINRTCKSVVCFNTPSINGACSWRMGEYLAMDKVIISTPMKVELPTEIKYLEVSDDPVLFEEQVEHLLKNPDTFSQLSNREFFERKMRPVAQIDYILEKIGCK